MTTISCATSLGHENCGLTLMEVEHEGHKASANAWERSRNKVYRRKIARQKNKGMVVATPTFKKGKSK